MTYILRPEAFMKIESLIESESAVQQLSNQSLQALADMLGAKSVETVQVSRSVGTQGRFICNLIPWMA